MGVADGRQVTRDRTRVTPLIRINITGNLFVPTRYWFCAAVKGETTKVFQFLKQVQWGSREKNVWNALYSSRQLMTHEGREPSELKWDLDRQVLQRCRLDTQ